MDNHLENEYRGKTLLLRKLNLVDREWWNSTHRGYRLSDRRCEKRKYLL